MKQVLKVDLLFTLADENAVAGSKKTRNFTLFSLAAAGVVMLSNPSAPTGAECRVVGIQDGDTLTLLTDEKKELKVRLSGIDAPESRQPFGSVSKKSLSDLVYGKTVHLQSEGVDRYGRTLGQIYAGRQWVNQEQVLRGMAWHYVRYSADRALAKAEVEARSARRGLWGDANPIPPWDWRRKGRSP